ncbi:FimV/HubP family polar landmark protein [Burkholderia sp. Ax-1724]|uniref:FimV/HubP family polar landmark protein n=1 Tax=Burkholderia sp. Ax-1724 TaxID=2608336 RepID=UPI001F036055|nr:FimV/HubP family polar landmark protein [Burkholderia sp. Ax-1724]
MSIHHDKGRFKDRLTTVAAAAALALALAGAGMGGAVAAPVPASASAPEAGFAPAVVTYGAGSQYTVRAGQSLNDVAIAVTQSHDKAVLARSTHALFDTNPAAFMNHDPSRLRVGAILIVPALDASGALAASSVAAAGAVAAASGASGAAVSAPTASASAPAVPVSTPTVAAAASAGSGAASAVAQVSAAAASVTSAATQVTTQVGTQAAAQVATSAAPAVSGAASVPVSASAVMSATAASGAAASAPVAGSQAAALPASGAQEWTGSVQSPASVPAAQAQAATSGVGSAAAAVQPASQTHPQVSSLQQLLALKNRVLMELQKHGIGGAPAVSGAAPTSAAQPAAGASPVTGAAPGQASVAPSPANDDGMSRRNLSIAAAIGAALIVLLSALRMGRRKREKAVAGHTADAVNPEMAQSAQAGDSQDDASARGQTAAQEASDVHGDEAARQAAALAAERAAAEQVAAERTAAERAAAEQAAAERAAAERAAAEQAAAERATAERVAADLAAPAHAATEHSTAEPDATAAPATAPQETLNTAATAASPAVGAEPAAEALSRDPLEPRPESAPQEERAHRLQWDDESTGSEATTNTPATPPAEPQQPLAEPQNPVPAPAIDFTQHPAEPDATAPLGQPHSDTAAPIQPTLPAPSAFPRDAVDAFSSLDMPLPPRVEAPTGNAEPAAPLSTQPVASPETTAQQAFAAHEPDDDAPHIADEIAAGTAGHGAVAGLGAAGFGALKLDFDLELPPSPAQPLPAFTQADLGRIARNKLELASEYIELGDLAGARALINEVIEANDPATRTEARALLSTLAPLS